MLSSANDQENRGSETKPWPSHWFNRDDVHVTVCLNNYMFVNDCMKTRVFQVLLVVTLSSVPDRFGAVSHIT